MKKKTRFPKKLEWMRSYLELGMCYLPEGVFIERVGTWTRNKSRGIDVHASLIRVSGQRFRMWLHTHWYSDDNKLIPISKISLLSLMAHELAHTVEMDAHTPRHEELRSVIAAAFMMKLRQDGYVSEEEEMGEVVGELI